jgi:hypothetical protein
MRPIEDPALLTTDARLREIAAIRAAGVLRLRTRAALPAKSAVGCGSENPAESALVCLTVLSETAADSAGALSQPHVLFC